MEFTIKYLYFLIIFNTQWKVLHAQPYEIPVTREELRDEYNSKLDFPESENIGKYAKYFAYTGIYYPDAYALMWSGVIIKRRYVLAAQVLSIKNYFDLIEPNNDRYRDRAYHVVMTGSRDGLREEKTEETVVRSDIVKRLSTHVSLQEPQLTILNLQQPLQLDNQTRWTITLGLKKYSPGRQCIALTGGVHHKYALRAIGVQIAEEETCLSKDGFCINVADNRLPTNVSHCKVLFGGEPIICEGTLAGLVNAFLYYTECKPDQARPSTSIYKNRKWIDEFFAESPIPVIKSKSSRLVVPSILLLSTIIMLSDNL